MTNNIGILLSTAYFAPLEYFAHIVNAGEIFVEREEHYVKQTYRNRCKIYTANGIQSLTIPVIKVNGNHTKIRDIEISYAEKWQMIHWRALNAAYSHSPFFLYFQDEIKPFFFNEYKYLFDYNWRILTILLDIIGCNIEMRFTESYNKKPESGIIDMRNEFSPKKESSLKHRSYRQVFAEKHGFIPNLSILDLIFNLGPESLAYLKQFKQS
jgi:hypothetical protein